MNIVFMGTPEFAVPSLEILIEHGFKPVAVVTRPDLPRGRGQKIQFTPIKEVALKHEIPVLQPESVRDPQFIADLQQLNIDVMVVVAFRILPPAVYQLAKRGAFNLHGSLLPQFRGAAPIHHAIMSGVAESGVTTFFLQEKVDTGNMILQKHVLVGENDTTGDLHDKLMHLGAEAVLQTVEMIELGNVVTLAQNNDEATPAPKISEADCEIRWENSAQEVHNQIRGLSPFPGAFTIWQSKRYKIFRSLLADQEGASGEAIVQGKRLFVGCGTGSIEVLEIQQEGRKRLSTEAFLAGKPIL
jgi:methionyl-tRNA formyltransferase